MLVLINIALNNLHDKKFTESRLYLNLIKKCQ